MINFKIENLSEIEKNIQQEIQNNLEFSVKQFLNECLEYLKIKYQNLPYPVKVNGEDVSKVHPSEIAEALQIVRLENNQMSIEIVSNNPDVEWSARRYAFLTTNGNPFDQLIQKIDSGSNIE